MKNKNYNIIRNRLEYARKNNHLSLEEVGNFLGVHKTTVARWENGHTEKIQLPVFQMLSDLYKVNTMWLMGYDVQMERHEDKLENKLIKLDKYMEENNLDKILLIPIYDFIDLKKDWKEHPTRYTPFDFKINNCYENKNYFYYKISNNFMNIEEGTYILIEDTKEVNINDIILYSLNNKVELGIYKIAMQQEKDFKILGKYIK